MSPGPCLASALNRLFILCALLALAACGSGGSGSADLDGGPSVNQELPVVTTAPFDDAADDPFVVGSSFHTAQFNGGVASGNGAWIVTDGNTAVVNFGTPADNVTFDAIPEFDAAAAAQKPAIQQPAQAVTSPFGDAPIWVRGSIKNDWATSDETLLVEVADNVVEATIALEAGDFQFKIADAGYANVNCGAADVDTITIGSAYTLACGSNPPNINISVPTAGDYKFSLNVGNVDAPVLTVTEDTGNGGGNGGGGEPRECGLTDQGNDNTVPYGVEIFVRGSVKNDWANADENQLINFGNNLYKVELEVQAAAHQFKIADAGYSTVNCGAGDSDTISVGTPFAAACGSNPPNINFTAAETTCYEFAVDVSTQTAPVITITKADLSGGGGEPTEEGFEIRLYDSSGGEIETIEGETTAVNVDETRIAAQARIGRVEIENLGGIGDLGIENFEWTADPRFAVDPVANAIDIYFNSPDGDYTGTTIEVDGESYDCVPTDDGLFGCRASGIPAYPYSQVDFVVHRGDGSTQTITGFPEDSQDLYSYDGGTTARTGAPATDPVTVAGAAAHWVLAESLLWTPPATTDAEKAVVEVALLHSPSASIASTPEISGDVGSIPLTVGTNPQLPNFRHLSNAPAWALPEGLDTKALLREQLVAVGKNAYGVPVQATRVQTPGAIDDVYAEAAYGVPLGVSYASGTPTLRIWAPTALLDPGVSVNIYDASGTKLDTVPMELDEASGIWSVTGTADWDRQYYTISLRVFTYATNAIVDNEVTDPYSVSLATDSVRSQFVNLDDPDLKPAGWDTLVKPALEAPEDIVLYETHVRDFSIADSTVPAADRGKYTAFDMPGTAGRQHLEQLAEAGLTHVHVLPAFDIATVKERREDRVELDDLFDDLCAANASIDVVTCDVYSGKTIRQVLVEAVAADRNSTVPQQVHGWLRNLDGFNWGYDPYHYGVPEGSYATDPEGTQRILEFRRMVKGLAEVGLRTVMDVVYNHTNGQGQGSTSVLDRIVPGYYHRRSDTTGFVLNNSCCSDTATEFRMMEKLMIDTAEIWARDYRIDGFRFDLMSFHSVDSMLRLKERVEAINPEFYVYGEGWNFGDIQDDKRFIQARQANLGGTGIGSFSDRIRDPIRGGGPFDNGINHVRNQGFISGQFYAPNAENSGSDAEKTALLQGIDNIKVWLAGGLEDYAIVNSEGNTVVGSSVDYAGQDSGYTADPQEAINYIDKHDNETLWDISQYKHATGTPTADRVRAHNVGYSMIILGQGVPFIHAGGDILRSKSMDRNSYDSGDWYNELDWSLVDTKWGQGLPPSGDNANNLPVIPGIVNDSTTEPVTGDLQATSASLREFLQIRKSTLLFRLRDGAQVKERVRFYNQGPDQIPGVVVMHVDGCVAPDLTPEYGGVVTVFNASTTSQTINLFGDGTWTLHPVQQSSADPIVQGAYHDATGFNVPARTTAVFVTAEQRPFCAPFPVDLYVRGSFTGWDATEAYKLEFLGGTAYSVTAAVPAGPQEFKVADVGYTDGSNCGADADVVLAEPVTLTCSGNTPNLRFNAPAADDYEFKLDATDTAAPILTVGNAPPFVAALYVRGINGDWGTTNPMSFDGIDRYTAVVADVTASAQQFKVADADWTSGTDCGGGSGGNDLTLGVPLPLNCAGGPNLNLNVTEAGSYFFSMNVANPAAPTLTVEKVPFAAALFVRGLNGDWSDAPTNRMGYVGSGTYHHRRALGAGDQLFKIADSGWTSGTDCGAAGPLVVNTPLVLMCAGGPNIPYSVVDPGWYLFSLDATNTAAPQLTVTGP